MSELVHIPYRRCTDCDLARRPEAAATFVVTDPDGFQKFACDACSASHPVVEPICDFWQHLADRALGDRP